MQDPLRQGGGCLDQAVSSLVRAGLHACGGLLAALQALQGGTWGACSQVNMSTADTRVGAEKAWGLWASKSAIQASHADRMLSGFQGLGFWQSAWFTAHKLIIGVTLFVRYMPHKLAPSIFPRECESARSLGQVEAGILQPGSLVAVPSGHGTCCSVPWPCHQQDASRAETVRVHLWATDVCMLNRQDLDSLQQHLPRLSP